MTSETPSNTARSVGVRLILPSGVKEIVGQRDWVAEEVVRLISLESDIGESFVEQFFPKEEAK